MFSTVAPFVSEYMYQEIRKKFRLNEESICLYDWPEADVKLIDKKLENSMAEANAMIQAIMAARDKEKINVRWPLSRATIYLYKSSIKDMYKPLLELISRQTNIKKIIFNVVDKSIDEKIEGFQFEHGYVVLDTELTKELEEEGYARELMRRVQALRKEAGLQKQNEIELYINIDVDLSKWKKQISERCGAKTVKLGSLKSVKYSADGEIRGKKFEIGFN